MTSRYLIGKYFSKLIFDIDFNVIKILERQNYFQNDKVIVDIGANDGMSYQIMRKFSKNTQIISFEPIVENFNILKKLKIKTLYLIIYNKVFKQ